MPSLLDLLFFFLDWFLELNFLDPYLGVFAGLFLDDGGDLDLERDREGDLDWDFLLDQISCTGNSKRQQPSLEQSPSL